MDKSLTEMLNEMVETLKETNALLDRITERNKKTYELLSKSIRTIGGVINE